MAETYMVVDKMTSIIHLFTTDIDEARDWIEREPEWRNWRYVIQIKEEK